MNTWRKYPVIYEINTLDAGIFYLINQGA